MHLTTYISPNGPRVAGIRDGLLIDLNQADQKIPTCIKKLLAQGYDGMERAKAALAVGKPIPAKQFQSAPPIPNPEKIICVGLNYADHARETNMQPPPVPVIFNKFPTAISADGLPIVLPNVSNEVDYEAELVVVIGQGGRHIPRDKAMQHIGGYCCGNDISARDWQIRKPGGQWLLGKSFDTFAPIGPAIITADEVPDPNNLKILLRLNGLVMQNSSTNQFIFPIDHLISYISDVCTLSPGDLIFTGTPSGVGFARNPPVFLKSGDFLEVEIENIGILKNSVAAEV